MAKLARELEDDQIAARERRQVSELLAQLEHGTGVTVRERTQALAAIARIRWIWHQMRKAKLDESEQSGSVVRKYATAFAPNAAGGRAAATGPAAAAAAASASAADAESESWFESDDDGDAA